MASTTLAADAGDWHADGRGKSKFQWELEAELGSNWKILELPNVCQTCFPPWCEKFKAHHCTMSTFKEQSLFTQKIMPSILCQSCKKSLVSQAFIPTWQLFNRFRLRLQWPQNLKRAGWNLLREKGDKCSVSSHCGNPAPLEQNLPGQEPELSWGKFDQSLGKKEFTEYLVLLQIKYKILDEIWIFISEILLSKVLLAVIWVDLFVI